jgi:hypothetical protein
MQRRGGTPPTTLPALLLVALVSVCQEFRRIAAPAGFAGGHSNVDRQQQLRACLLATSSFASSQSSPPSSIAAADPAHRPF